MYYNNISPDLEKESFLFHTFEHYLIINFNENKNYRLKPSIITNYIQSKFITSF